MSSSICSCISRAVTALQRWRMRSDSVVFPWSMWATIEKLRMRLGSVIGERRDAYSRPVSASPSGQPATAAAGPAARSRSGRPARRNRSRPAHAIIAALSVVKERSGRWTGTPCSRRPRPRASRAARCSRRRRPRGRASGCPRRAWTAATRSSRASTIARWKDASRSTSSGVEGAPGRAASRRRRASRARAASRSSGPRRRSRASRRPRVRSGSG